MIEESKRLYLLKTIEVRYIIINVVVFLLVTIASFFTLITTSQIDLARNWLSVPSQLGDVIFKPWTLFTYMFTHKGIFHLLFNMVFLYFSGRIFSDLLGAKKFIVTYWMGGILGAIFFLIGYGLSSELSAIDAPLLGASASVFAIFIAIATTVPNYTVMLPLIGPAKLKYIAIVFVVLSLPITAGNTGGHLAHLGGLTWGLMWAYYLKRGLDIAGLPYQIYDGITAIFTGQKKVTSKRKSRRKTKTNKDSNSPSQKEIDIILDKVSKSGYESLSKKEKDILFKASK